MPRYDDLVFGAEGAIVTGLDVGLVGDDLREGRWGDERCYGERSE